MSERKRRSLADTLRAVDPIASLQGTAQIMRLISSHRDPSEKPEPKESEAPEAVHSPEATKPPSVVNLVSSVGPIGSLNVYTETTSPIPTVPTELTAGELTELTATTEATKTKNKYKGGLTEPTEPTEPSEPTIHHTPLLGLAPSRIVFLNHVLKHRGRFDREFVSWAQVSRETGLSLSAIKRLTKELSEKGIIRVQFDLLHRKGSRVYLIEDHAKALSGLLTPGNRMGWLTKPTELTEMTELTETTWSKKSALTEPTEPTEPTTLEDKKIKNSNLSKGAETERLLQLSDEQVKFHYPHLGKIGFGVDQLRKIISNLERISKSPEKLQVALDHANHEWGNAQQLPLTDASGNPIRKPLDYVFSTLAKTGYYRRPEGYVSPEEQAELDQEAELRALVNVRERVEQAKFDAWVASLADEEREKILEIRPGHRPGKPKGVTASTAELAWLKSHWIKTRQT